MKHQCNFAVFIGRFQTYHNGHQSVVLEGLDSADHLIILVGSAYKPRSPRNPFTFEERRDMILNSLTADERERVTVSPIVDTDYNMDIWLRDVHQAVIAAGYRRAEHSIALIGHSKDSTSYYLEHFPSWKSINVGCHKGLSATQMRDVIFSNNYVARNVADALTSLPMVNSTIPELNELRKQIPESTRDFLNGFVGKAACRQVKAERDWAESYKAPYANLPYPPIFVTVDAVVLQAGHVLMVTRGEMPGKGLLALPGGFLNQNETLEDAAVRELREETRLKVPLGALKGDIKSAKRYQFDDPHRSTRGRTVTTAFRIDLRPSDALPEVRGGDDAAKAEWIPLAELDTREIFEDHYAIIMKMLSL